MQVKNKRPWAVEIATTGQTVEPGGTVEVDDELGRSLCEQPDNWEAVKASKSKSAAAGEEA